MKRITVKDKQFELYISADKIQKAVDKVANEINLEIEESASPIFLVVLNGSFMFAADLMKKLNPNIEISFIKLSSYEGTQTTNKVNTLIGLKENIEGRTVYIIEDIIDTGITMEKLIDALKAEKPKDVKLVSLLFKPAAFKKEFKIDYVGMDIPNDFIIGYGLDYDGFARNLPDIYKIVEKN